ncbi:MAG: hypothetical protein ACD_21C00267G0011 [uncultured bacterium]|nr:MAG: hypothetical protein ACD_21C00267G0011 [uncultured bacterium]
MKQKSMLSVAQIETDGVFAYYYFLSNYNPSTVPAPNLIKQNFAAEEPNQRWVAGFHVYCYPRRLVVCGSCYERIFSAYCRTCNECRMTNSLVMAALKQAIIHRQPDAGLIHPASLYDNQLPH